MTDYRTALETLQAWLTDKAEEMEKAIEIEKEEGDLYQDQFDFEVELSHTREVLDKLRSLMQGKRKPKAKK